MSRQRFFSAAVLIMTAVCGCDGKDNGESGSETRTESPEVAFAANAEFGGDESDEPDDGTPGLGTMWRNGKPFTLRHATSYKSKFFDDPCTVVLLSPKPIQEQRMNELIDSLRENGNDDRFFPSGKHIKLTLDDEGNLVSLFAWVDGLNVNSNSGVETEITIDGTRVRGTAGMAETAKFGNSTFRFQAEFDVQIIQPE